MSEPEAIITRQRAVARCDQSSALPQWALEICRPIVHLASRVLWRIKFQGVENIPVGAGGFVVVANHQTYLDPFWVSIPIKKPTRYLAWSAAFDWFLVGRLMPLFGAWPLQIEGGETKPIRRAINWLRAGGAVMIFPEGGRGNPDGTMVHFKPGAARIALEAGVPVLPATIRGGHRVWSKDKRLPRLARVEVIYHPPQILTCKDGEDTRACARRETARLASIIQSAL